jgi:two-component system phosphate regulon response regulator PhoB
MANILLIEPDRLLAEIYQQALSREGHNVTACAGAQSAILSADQQTPDLVILELQLVEHSGIEFLYEFRSYSEWQHIPVIIHTMVPAGEFSRSGQLLETELGVYSYLYKPRTSLNQLLSNAGAVNLQRT